MIRYDTDMLQLYNHVMEYNLQVEVEEIKCIISNRVSICLRPSIHPMHPNKGVTSIMTYNPCVLV